MTRSSTSGGPLCMTLEENQKHVQNAAFDRYMQDLEKEAKEAVKDLHSFRSTVQGGFDQDAAEMRKKRQLAEQNQVALMNQMENNKSKRAELRREYIHNASAHSFPLFTETFIDLEAFERIRKEQKELWRKELDQQKETNDMLRNIEERKARELSEAKHRENISTMTRDRAKEYERLANQGREMVNSWDRDVRIKALRKAMETGHDVTAEVAKHRLPQGPGYMRR